MLCRFPVFSLLLASPALGLQDPDALPLRAPLEWEPGIEMRGERTRAKLSESVPEGVIPPPGIQDGRYASLPLGDVSELHVALDVQPGRERVWIDHDFDGDFRNDAYSRWDESGSRWERSESVLVPFSGREQPVPAEIRVSRWNRSGWSTIDFEVRSYKLGRVVLADRERSIGLRDDGHRLRFDQGDGVVLLVDVDGDGALDWRSGSHESFGLGEGVRIGDEAWSFRVIDASGSAVDFTPLAELPPERPRAWFPSYRPPSGVQDSPPRFTMEELEAAFEQYRAEGKRQLIQATLDAVGDTGSDDAFRMLSRIERTDRAEAVRIMAVRAMGNAAFLEGHGSKVVKLTRDESDRVASAAIQSLHRMGHPGRSKLYADLLDADDPAVARTAARYLAFTDSESTEKLLVRGFEEIDDAQVRAQAYAGLRSRPEGPPLEVMLSAAADESVSLQSSGLADLFLLGRPEARELALEAISSRPIGVYRLSAVVRYLAAHADEECLEALLALPRNTPPQIRSEIVRRLGSLRGEAAIDTLLDGLSGRDAERRELCARILEGIRSKRVCDALVKRLKRERHEEVSQAIVEALGDQGRPEAVQSLLSEAKKRGQIRDLAILSLARIGLELPSVRKFLLGLLDSRDWQERVLAIQAAANHGDVELGYELLPNLDHERWQVRLATVDALRDLPLRDWVEPLIAQLERDERLRVRLAIADTLHELTGVNFYVRTELWQRWFAEQGATFAVPASGVRRAERPVGDTASSFYGIPIDSDRVVFVIDRSGSMAARDTSLAGTANARATRLEVAIAEVRSAIGDLPDGHYANVLFFETEVEGWREELARLKRPQRKELDEYLDEQIPGGGTNLYDALEWAFEDPEVDKILVLSDGQPTGGRFTSTDDILRAIRRVNQVRRISIDCISLGRESQLLRDLAAENDGRYVRR